MAYGVKDLTEFSELIGILYDSVSNPAKLEIFLARIAKQFDAIGAQILCSNFAKQEFLFNFSYGFDRTILNKYAEYAFKDPALPHSERFETKIFSDRRIPDVANFLETKISREFLQPMGIYERAGFIVHIDQEQAVGFSLMAGKNRQPFTDLELHMMGELQPHILRAISLQLEMNKAKFTDNVLLEALHKVPIGVVLADRNCNVFFANRAASAICGRNNAVGMRHGAIYCSNADQNRNLYAMIEAVTAAETSDSLSEPAVCRVEHPDDQNPLLITISDVPQNKFGPDLGIENQPAALIYICDPGIQQETSETLLRRMFGLTPSEAKTLKNLVEGLSVQEISKTQGLTVETVRSYLKQIFEKMECSRQSELIGMVLKSPAWVIHSKTTSLKALK